MKMIWRCIAAQRNLPVVREVFIDLLHQQLRDLDAVGGGALADLVAAAPQAQAVGVGQVGTDTAHEHDVLSGGIQGHGVLLILQVIHQLHAGGLGQHLPGFLHGNAAVEAQLDGNGVASHDRHTDAGAGNVQLRQVHDLPALVLHLHFLAGVALELLAADLGDQVVGDLVGEGLDIHVLTLLQGLDLVFQLRHTGNAGAGNGLVGGGDHALDGGDGIEGIDGGDGDDGGAVGIADDALVVLHILGVDLGNDQGHVGVQTESGGVIHKNRAGLDDGGGKLLGDVVLGGTQDDIHALEGGIAGFPDGHILTPELQGLTGGPGRGQGDQLTHGEIPLFQNSHHLLAHRTGGTKDGNSVLFHGDYLHISYVIAGPARAVAIS